jgi:hypothetical protein
MSLTIDIGEDGLKLLKRLQDRSKTFRADIVRFFDGQAKFVAGRVSATMLSGQRLNRRTGALARSITGRGELYKGQPAMRVGVFRGPALAYAGIQEYGGVIKPKKAKALAIPVGPALTPAGVPRFSGPREKAGLVFVRFRGGNAIGGLFDKASLAAADGLKGALLFYLLVEKVTIRGQHYLRDGVRESLDDVTKNTRRFIRNLLYPRDERGRFVGSAR